MRNWVPVFLAFGLLPGAAAAEPLATVGNKTIDRAAVGLSQMSLNTGAQTTYPPNPSDAEGFDPPEIVSRGMTCQIDPNAVLVATRDILSDMRAGTSRVIHARLKGGNASRPGARLGVVVPDAFYTGFSPTDRQGISAECAGGVSGRR